MRLHDYCNINLIWLLDAIRVAITSISSTIATSRFLFMSAFLILSFLPFKKKSPHYSKPTWTKYSCTYPIFITIIDTVFHLSGVSFLISTFPLRSRIWEWEQQIVFWWAAPKTHPVLAWDWHMIGTNMFLQLCNGVAYLEGYTTDLLHAHENIARINWCFWFNLVLCQLWYPLYLTGKSVI